MSSSYSPFPGPTPAYTNPPIEPQNFEPSRFQISAITLGTSTIVTTTVNHNYVIGQQCRIVMQPYSGARALNEQTGFVTAIPAADQVTLNIFSVGIDPFISSPAFDPTPPQIVAIGDSSSGLISTTGRALPTTAIPGSFQNISPQPPITT
jgi:hypothetical protein